MKTPELLRSLGEMIRSKRVAAGLSQRALGERAGIGGKYVSEIERGTRDIPISTLLTIVQPGLHLQLDIAFRQKDVGSPAGPAHNDVAAEIGELPMEIRAKVVTIVRGILELAQ